MLPRSHKCLQSVSSARLRFPSYFSIGGRDNLTVLHKRTPTIRRWNICKYLVSVYASQDLNELLCGQERNAFIYNASTKLPVDPLQ